MSFFDGGNKALSFGQVGDNTWFGKWQGGRILNISQPVQQMDFNDTSKPKTYKNGDPVMKIIVTLDTRSGRFPAPPLDAEDDGIRDWHIEKGFLQAKSVAKALKDTKADDIAVGGELYVRWTSGVGAKGDARQFESAYQAPAQTSGGAFDEPSAAAPQQAPSQPLPPQQPAGNPFAGGQPAAPQAPAQQSTAPMFDPATGAPMNDAARAIIASAQQVQAAANVPNPAPVPQQPANPFAS